MKKRIIYISLILIIIATIFLTYYHHRDYNTDDYRIVYIVQSPTTTQSSAAQYYSKYHCAGCNYMFGVPERVTLSYAKTNGYGACPRCNPTYIRMEEVKENTVLINIIQFIVTICLYSIIPICLKIFTNKNFTNKQAIIISFLNFLILFIIISILFNNDGTDHFYIALISSMLNYFILKIIKQDNIYTTKIN